MGANTSKGSSKEKIKKGLPVLGGRFKLLVSEDGLEAVLRPNEEDSLSPEDIEELKKVLKECGITYGLLEPPVFEKGTWIVARGFPPQPGKHGDIELLKSVRKDLEEADEDGTKDYREVNKIVCVRKGEAIAKRHPPQPGKPGRDVFGRALPPPSVKESPLKLGKNVFLEAETQLIKAGASGVLLVSDKKLEIHPTYTLEGDVDWDTGNIYFVGKKLVITGNVCRGFKVCVEGDLEINGIVENEAQIEVTGNLIIEGLVHGDALCVRVKGDARFNEVEYATIEVEGSVVVGEYCLQAKIKSGGDLIVTEGIGAIIGGEYRAKGNILARILGSKAYVPTLVHAAYDARSFEEWERVLARLDLIEKEKLPLLQALNKALVLLRQKKLPCQKIEIVKKVKEALERLKREEDYLLQKKKKLLRELARGEKCKVIAMSHVFPKVTIAIGRFQYLVVEKKEKVSFALVGNQIVPRELHL